MSFRSNLRMQEKVKLSISTADNFVLPSVPKTQLAHPRRRSSFKQWRRNKSLPSESHCITKNFINSVEPTKLDIDKATCKISGRALRAKILLISIICNLFIILIEGRNDNQAADTSSAASEQSSQSASSCFGGLQTFEKISMSSFENPNSSATPGDAFGGGVLIQQEDQALTSECVNLCKSQSNCLSFVIDYNKFECKSYATTQQELQMEMDLKYQNVRSVNSSSSGNASEPSPGYQQASASTLNFQQLLPSTSSNYFEKICLDGETNRNQFNDVCGQGRLWAIERVVDSFLDGFVEKEVTNINNKDDCSKLCILENQFVCRSADYDHDSRLCRLSKEDRRTQPQSLRYIAGSNRQYLENQCATPGPSSCVYETKRNLGIISMDALKFAQTVQDCQMKCNQESTFNCRSYSFHQQRCFLSGDDSSSLNSNLIKFPMKQGWQFGEKKCLVELCTKGMFSYEKITGYTLRSALSTPIDLMMPSSSFAGIRMAVLGANLDDLEKLQNEASQTRLQHLLPSVHGNKEFSGNPANVVSTMMMMAANSDSIIESDPMLESASYSRHQRSSKSNNLAITNHCRHSCDLGYLNCPAFTIDYRNNRCQRLDRNSQGRHQELIPRDGHSYFEKICLRVPEIMTMCQDKYWIFERVIGFELAPRFYEKTLKFVQSRRDCQEYCLEEKQFQCLSALFNDEISECKLSRFNRRVVQHESGFYRNFNSRISYMENQCIRDREAEKRLHCSYERAREEPSYPVFTEHIEMVPPPPPPEAPKIEMESARSHSINSTTSISSRYGAKYCEMLCTDSAKFDCHSFGYYASAAQCFLSGDDSISAGDAAAQPSSGFVYYEKSCKLMTGNHSSDGSHLDNNHGSNQPEMINPDPNQILNPYLQPTRKPTQPLTNNGTSSKPSVRPVIDQSHEANNSESTFEVDRYKCGLGQTFVYQRIMGFEPIGGFLTLLIRNHDSPGIVSQCSEMCKRAYECRAFVVDYNSNQCFAMLENSSVGLLSLRQTIGKDYFEGFCIPDHLLSTGYSCRNKTWIIDKIVDQAVLGIQYQKVIPDSNGPQCRQACLEERLFWCKSAMFDGTTSDCKLYSVDRESMPQMRLLFTKGVDFFENQCQIMSSSCPYDAIERDITIVTTTKSTQARSTSECELHCNRETSFNCRSYTYLEQYPSLPNLCSLSSDSRSTSQKGSVREQRHALYAERNCNFRRPRYPYSSSSMRPDPYDSPAEPTVPSFQSGQDSRTSGNPGMQDEGRYYTVPPRFTQSNNDTMNPSFDHEVGPILGQGCEPHQYTFERTFGYDFRFGHRERAPIAQSIGIAIGCQQECLRRADRCQSFVVEYGLPYQSCFLFSDQVGANKRLLMNSTNSVYFEKVCLPRNGVDYAEQLGQTPISTNGVSQPDMQSMDIAPSYSSEPWTPQVVPQPQLSPHYLQLQQLVQNYPSRSCSKLWSFERFINHNFTATPDKTLDNILTRAACETHCLNEAGFSCRSATYDYSNKICRMFKHTRRTLMSQFIDLESPAPNLLSQPTVGTILPNSQPGTAQVIMPEIEGFHTSQSTISNSIQTKAGRSVAQQVSVTVEPQSFAERNIDYMENTCIPEPSSCQYRQLYDLFSLYIDKINHAVSLGDCQRQCDNERLFSCKSINYDPATKNCMLINEDLISLNRGQHNSLIPRKNSIYSEKGNCEMVSVQCNSQEMLVSINFDSPFRGRISAKGNPEQCYLVGDGQSNIQFPIVFGPKCNSRQEGHNTFVNEVIIQQHPVIMTDSDKTIRVMCAFEAPDQTITLKNPSSRDNKTGIDVGTPETSRTRYNKQQFNPVVSNKAAPPSVLLRILDLNERDASMINLGDDLVLKIQLQVDGQNSALGIFARNLAARSSNGETLLLIDNEGCPVDPMVFPALGIDPKDGRSLHSNFKAFRFPSSGLVNFEVQIRFCPERCQPVDCDKGQKSKSYGRKKREALIDGPHSLVRTSIIQSHDGSNQEVSNPLENLSTVMKPGKAFQYVRELFLAPQVKIASISSEMDSKLRPGNGMDMRDAANDKLEELPASSSTNSPDAVTISRIHTTETNWVADGSFKRYGFSTQVSLNSDSSTEMRGPEQANEDVDSGTQRLHELPFQKSILMHVDEKVLPSAGFAGNTDPRLVGHHSGAPYGRFPFFDIESHHRRQNFYSNDNPPAVYKPTLEPEKYIHQQEPNLGASGETVESSSSLFKDRDTQQNNDAHSDETSINSEQYNNNNNNNRVNQAPSSNEAASNRDMPLRFSILVGDQQSSPKSSNWTPKVSPAPVSQANSSNENLDHVVVPGKEGQMDLSLASTPNSLIDAATSESSLIQPYGNDLSSSVSTTTPRENSKRNTQNYEQTFDAQPSNSIAAEIHLGHHSALNDPMSNSNIRSPRPLNSEAAASHDCRHNHEAGSSKLWTIIWTGTIVIALNVCLVVLSLLLYLRRVHSRQNHDFVRSTSSNCDTQSSRGASRWPSVLLKSKNNLGTSLNTHEHFFCKLNTKTSQTSSPLTGRHINWPNLSTSSANSTLSSMANAVSATSIRVNQTHPYKTNFDPESSLSRSNLIGPNHTTIYQVQSYNNNNNNKNHNDKLNACYLSNFDHA